MQASIVAVLAAAVSAFIFGAIWYGVLSASWLAAQGRSMADMIAADGRFKPPIVPMVVSFIALIVMAIVLGGMLSGGATAGGGIKRGIATGALMWLGFVITTLVANHAYQGAKRQLTLIDGGHWLGALMIEGAVLGLLTSSVP
ncbi:DUF1761 domain-containing protein [Roseiarcaceae bacterium H3SJ34-1]|uniref:DUF1761 domain-containing protein n=1 Tax=Terripilifer ovatus TaxID=3032367 RepID=UPI003AB99998|nr:DUF1761 domain-containing protein [Roseiarcaceae bacterium H3SJ34-1]